MKTIKSETKEVKTTVYICDFCDTDAVTCCAICGKDICRNHTVYDDEDYGDYPDKYCESCWNIGEEYRRRIQDIVMESDRKIEKLEKEWKRKAQEE